MPARDNHSNAEISGITRRNVLKGVTALAASAAFTDAALVKSQDSSLAEIRHVPLADARDQSFDTGWRFHLGDLVGAERADFNDANWRMLDLPHDWSIEDLPPRRDGSNDAAIWAAHNVPARIGPFDRDFGEGQTATGFVMGGTGWYRKRFSIAHLSAGRRFEIRFDGVYMDSDIWLNGQYLGNHPYGYTSFAFDLTPHLHHDGENVLAVRVRNEGKNSRWYSGSGVYRHVWLTVTGDVRIPLWGIYVTTPEVSVSSATVLVRTQIQNYENTPQNATARIRLIAPDGGEAALEKIEQAFTPNDIKEVSHSFVLASPETLVSRESKSLSRRS
jgi:beta-galactosidase